jgi:hypothetical protein
MIFTILRILYNKKERRKNMEAVREILNAKRVPVNEVKLPVLKDFIIGEREMPFKSMSLEACGCISRCSCNCNNVKCSVFIG